MPDLFEEKARDWDVNDMVRQLSSAIGGAILDRVALTGDMDIMDFGAGTGLISGQVASRTGTITAVDISEAMLEKLSAKPELQGKVTTVCQDITSAPLDRKFDVIVSAMAMHHVMDTDHLIETFAAHLEPGGRVALADLDAEDGGFHPEGTEGVYHQGFDRDALSGLLQKHGFRDIEFVTAHTAIKENGEYPVFLVTAGR